MESTGISLSAFCEAFFVVGIDGDRNHFGVISSVLYGSVSDLFSAHSSSGAHSIGSPFHLSQRYIDIKADVSDPSLIGPLLSVITNCPL